MPSLTRPEARARAELVAVQDYQLHVDLTGDGETFRSATTIRFTATRPGAETFVELRPCGLPAARLNGTMLAPAELAGGRLRLAGLRAENQLEVTAEFRYSHASEGMHRFTDPVDGAVYVYAQPSIAYAPALMACFDQPDLKAPVTVRVSADPSWLVRGNGAATQLAPGRWEHEMAHMWFGNLVTMQWWDDLWLNESFADYLGWRVVAEATRWRTAWTSYAVSRKLGGYAADQRPSTHPVAAAEVPDTVVALANFDGISYAKGSAVLRQLVAWVGDEAFRAGLRSYFETYAYRNATLADLLAALSTASGRDLAGWARVWLREPQVNTLHLELTHGNGGPPGRPRLRLRQTAPPGYPVLRPHRIQVGVYHQVDGALVRRERVPVDLDPDRDGELTEVPELAGLADLDGGLVLVNDGDLTFAKVRPAGLDPAVALPRLAHPHARALLWATLWDACRDGDLPVTRFVELAVAALPVETVPGVFESMLGLTLDPAIARYLPPAERPAAYAAVAEVCRAVVARAGPGSGAQLAAARGLVRCAGEPDLGWLSGWLAGAAPPGLVVDPDVRWAVLLRLASLGAVEPARIDQEQRRDPTERGRQEATRCRAARPDPAAKESAWQLVTADRELSNRIVVAAAGGFWQPDQPDLAAPYVPRYFAEIGATAGWRPEQMLATVTRAAYPGYAVAPATVAVAQKWLADGAGHPIIRREIVDATDDLRRALAVRAAAGEPDMSAPGSGAEPDVSGAGGGAEPDVSGAEPDTIGAGAAPGRDRRRVGIMGGTFDPIHHGHLVAASEVAERFALDEVVFVPTGQPWQKGSAASPAEDRYLMTVIATASNPRFRVSRVDIDRGGPTYTVDTLRDLRTEYGERAELFFITGADALDRILSWKDADEVFGLTHFVGVTRPGFELSGAHLPADAVSLVQVPAMAISSTDCRARVAVGKPVWYLVPDGVVQYITKRHLYRLNG